MSRTNHKTAEPEVQYVYVKNPDNNKNSTEIIKYFALIVGTLLTMAVGAGANKLFSVSENYKVLATQLETVSATIQEMKIQLDQFNSIYRDMYTKQNAESDFNKSYTAMDKMYSNIIERIDSTNKRVEHLERK